MGGVPFSAAELVRQAEYVGEDWRKLESLATLRREALIA
jgi:hypothetical protein